MMRWDDLGDLCRVYVGDCREAMTLMPAQSVHCVVTSPPYWSHRDYGLGPVAWADGDRCPFGLERTIDGYVRHTVEVFEALRRVLRPDGVIWWNIGDGMNDRGGRLFTPARVAMALQETTFIDVTIWGKQADVVTKYTRAGSPLMVEGYLKSESWEDKKTGQRRSKLKVVAENVVLLRQNQKGGVPRSHNDEDVPF